MSKIQTGINYTIFYGITRTVSLDKMYVIFKCPQMIHMAKIKLLTYSVPDAAICVLSANLHGYSCGLQWSNLPIRMLRGRTAELGLDKYLP